ncbi:acetyltransferase [Eggerthellaceae bacterium zg-893]|nr:acetyltransferase [Eggerthellaceae bacterium zg-893]
MDNDDARKTERERMLAGELYRCDDAELAAMRSRARRLVRMINEAEGARPQREVLAELFAAIGPGSFIEPPFRCDYGAHISIGKNFYANFDCIMLDCAPITVGDNVMLGPRVVLCTATHPIDAATRRSGLEMARPIRIGNDVWIGANAVVNPGVVIGDRTVIGSGSVVTRDVPSDVVAAGNPCRVIRKLDTGNLT